jgi:hypothetical protein
MVFWHNRETSNSDCKLHRVYPSVCLSARIEYLCSHWTDFHEICYFENDSVYVEKIQVSLKSDNNNGCLT